MTDLLLGVDAGTTVTKAVLFDASARELARASRRVPLTYPAPHHVERDQEVLWQAVAEAIREVLTAVPGSAQRVRSVGITSHGDGVYLVDEHGLPTRPGIMSLDTRARDVVEGWDRSGVSDDALALTGQRPWPSSPAALMAWLMAHEPDVVAGSRWALAAKDALRFRMCGVVATEPTEASLAFTNVRTQVYDSAVLDMYGLSSAERLLAPVKPCDFVVGHVTAEAAALTGLVPGTPVAGSAHDVDCSAIGTGVIAPGTASVVAGSFSINQVISAEPVTGDRWLARNFVSAGLWMNMAISPTSSANMEWFVQQFAADELARGQREGDPFAFVDRDIASIESDPSDVVFLPFLYGSPLPTAASAAFLGLQGWHRRGHLLRAVMEGVAFTHRIHVDDLASSFRIDDVRLTGGASRSHRWCQIFADAFQRPIEVTNIEESGAWGSAMLAGLAAGVFPSLVAAVESTVTVEHRYLPNGDHLNAAYRDFTRALVALDPYWRAHA